MSVRCLSHEITHHRTFVFDVLLLLASLHFEQRRLSDVNVALFYQRRHLAIEERQQQRANVRAVDVGVRHQNDLVITELRDIEIVFADAGAERRDQRFDFAVAQHLVEARFFDVQDLSLEWKDRLVLAIASLFGGTACRIALDDIDFR